MLRLAFDFIITWRETRTRPNAYLASKWRGVVTQVIRLLHLGETINSTKCSKANILYFYYTIPCCLFVILLVINVLLSACIDCFFLSL